MRSLIINADDVGLSGAVNEAVRNCYREGSITGASAMACGGSFPEASEMLKEAGRTDVGAHLTLTGRLLPCTADTFKIKTLTGADGFFLKSYRELAGRFFTGKIDLDEIYLEFRNQVEKIRNAGLNITHLDSHEHVHMLPGLLDIAVKLAWESGIPYLRLPVEPALVALKRFSVKDLLRRLSLAVFTLNAKKQIREKGVHTNDFFWGHFHAGRVQEDVFYFMLDRLGDGVNELAVHPAAVSEDFLRDFPWYKDAGKEYEFLLSRKWKDRLTAAGIRLATHKQATEKR